MNSKNNAIANGNATVSIRALARNGPLPFLRVNKVATKLKIAAETMNKTAGKPKLEKIILMFSSFGWRTQTAPN